MEEVPMGQYSWKKKEEKKNPNRIVAQRRLVWMFYTVGWIMENLKHPACTEGWVAWLLQLAFPGESNLNFLLKKSQWDNTVVKTKNDLNMLPKEGPFGCFTLTNQYMFLCLGPSNRSVKLTLQVSRWRAQPSTWRPCWQTWRTHQRSWTSLCSWMPSGCWRNRRCWGTSSTSQTLSSSPSARPANSGCLTSGSRSWNYW